eukprot:TRINITY_DN784_c0_g1_i6.p1 TRINITY_DN784_c0_g1~~TRINITY_DN784_c0_g1_i6.p1  ORF type:complete len:328 (+),score=43.10 TRINITY_DN784_c0_g1_i6:411-1394(+)
MEISFLPNYWTGLKEGLLRYSLEYVNQLNEAETTLMGFPPFKDRYLPSLEEAFDRPIYTCVNAFNIAGGCLPFGEISLVMKPSYVQNMTIISAVDTGYYLQVCKHLEEVLEVSVPLEDCQSWAGPATYQDFNHLFLYNAEFWSYNLAQLFQRQYGIAASISETLTFYEGDIAGSITFPEAVFYVQVNMPGVFGTETGRRVQEWCKSNNWPLVWSAGYLSNSSYRFSLDDMFLDPVIAPVTTNISGNVSSVVFDDAWESVSSYVASLSESEWSQLLNNGTYWDSIFTRVYQTLEHPTLRVAYPKIDSCVDDSDCFVQVADSGVCICVV